MRFNYSVVVISHFYMFVVMYIIMKYQIKLFLYLMLICYMLTDINVLIIIDFLQYFYIHIFISIYKIIITIINISTYFLFENGNIIIINIVINIVSELFDRFEYIF